VNAPPPSVERYTPPASSPSHSAPRSSRANPPKNLTSWTEFQGPDGVVEYQRNTNAKSLDGLTGVDWLARN